MSKAFGFGVATIAANGDVLDTWFLALGLGDSTSQIAPNSSNQTLCAE